MNARARLVPKRALLGALFCCLPYPVPGFGTSCGAAGIVEWARVRHVHDGDTIRLSDGRRVRLIGIDTPEVAREDRAAEPFAKRARQRLNELIAGSDHRVGLRHGRERHDDYGRWLAHLYDRDKRNLSAALLSEGLAVILPVTPNLSMSDCYTQAEARARLRTLGLWAHENYRERTSAELGPGDLDAYRLVRGTVQRIGQGRSALWLNLDGDFALRLPRDDLTLFSDWEWHRIEGRELRARGQVYMRNGQLRMSIHHPDMLELLD